MDNKTGIYKITNKVNSKVYYGSAAMSFKKRWALHEWQLNNNKHENRHLQGAWNKYGADAFEFSIIMLCDSKNCLYYEQLFLDKYFDNCMNCYNICSNAISALGIKRSAETKQKLSDALTGRQHSELTIEKMRLANMGRKSASNDNKAMPAGVKIANKNICKTMRYEASIRIDGKYIYLGTFDTIEDASQSYRTAFDAHILTIKQRIERLSAAG